MADNVLIPGAGAATAGTDEIGGIHYQQIKIKDGTLGSTVDVPAPAGFLYVDPHPDVARIQVVPSITAAGVYAAGDAIGGLLTFANAARVSGGACVIEQVIVVDNDQERSALDVVFFNVTFTAPTDNAAFDPTDAELATSCASVSIVGAGQYLNFVDNSVAVVNCGQVVKLVGTSLFGAVVSRGTPTYTATTDITVTVSVTRL